MLEDIKRQLLASIDTIISTPKQFVLHPDKDFSRTSPLSLKQMIAAILTMGGKSLSKELLDLDLPVSPSAFVQRRYRIKSQAFYDLFKDFTAKLPSPNDLPVLAVDGSDVSIPRNRLDQSTAIQTGKSHTPYNLIHINALYELESGTYQDLVIQDKAEADERAALVTMMENSPF